MLDTHIVEHIEVVEPRVSASDIGEVVEYLERRSRIKAGGNRVHVGDLFPIFVLNF
jgi:hypothetical protein